MKKRRTSKRAYVVCVRNDGYSASLELRKIYRVLSDEDASLHRLIRVIDESGDDYLYPASFFVAVSLPETVRRALARAG
jgi:hypothetical protein